MCLLCGSRRMSNASSLQTTATNRLSCCQALGSLASAKSGPFDICLWLLTVSSRKEDIYIATKPPYGGWTSLMLPVRAQTGCSHVRPLVSLSLPLPTELHAMTAGLSFFHGTTSSQKTATLYGQSHALLNADRRNCILPICFKTVREMRRDSAGCRGVAVRASEGS